MYLEGYRLVSDPRAEGPARETVYCWQRRDALLRLLEYTDSLTQVRPHAAIDTLELYSSYSSRSSRKTLPLLGIGAKVRIVLYALNPKP